MSQWAAALSALPDDRRERIGSELTAVQELAGSEGIAHLLEAAGEAVTAPDGIPDGAPLALWFLLQHPGVRRTARAGTWLLGTTSRLDTTSRKPSGFRSG